MGGWLAQAAHDVTFVGRPYFTEVVTEKGLTIHDEQGTQTLHPINAVNTIAEAFNPSGNPPNPHLPETLPQYDLAIVTVKSYDTAAILQDFAAVQAQGLRLPAVLSLQNGVGNEEAFIKELGNEKVIAGTVATPVSIREAGTIQVEKPDYTIGLSGYDADAVAQLDDLDNHLQTAGFTIKRYPQPEGMKWTKLLMNMVGNASSAILDAPPAEVFVHNHLVDLEIEAWREALAVMRASKIRPVNIGSYPFRILAPLIRLLPKRVLRPVLRKRVAGARGGKMPSLYLDLDKGKPHNEVGWLNGAVVEQGRSVGVATPANQLLYETLMALVQNPEKRNEWQHKVGDLHL